MFFQAEFILFEADVPSANILMKYLFVATEPVDIENWVEQF